MLSTSEDELDEQACAEGVLDLVYLGDVKDIDPSNLAGERPLARRGRRRERSEHGRSRGCANTASALRVRAKKPRGAREKDDCPRPRTRGRKGVARGKVGGDNSVLRRPWVFPLRGLLPTYLPWPARPWRRAS